MGASESSLMRCTLSDIVFLIMKACYFKYRSLCNNDYFSGKENRFCYYIGGLEESATGILGEMSNPMSWGMPMEKVCEKLKKKDAQICDLRYGKYSHVYLLFIRDRAVS